MMRLLLLILMALAYASSAAAAPVDMRETMPLGPLVHGQKTTNSSNGSEALASTTAVRGVQLKSSCTNTVDVHIGATGLNASSSKGYTLSPCETLFIPIDDLADIFVDSGTTTAIVEYLGVQGP